jgi:hypothetical protein
VFRFDTSALMVAIAVPVRILAIFPDLEIAAPDIVVFTRQHRRRW